MELINNFGINPILLVAQIVNFLIILFVLRKYLYKPMLDVLDKRRKMIQDGIENAEKAQILLDKTEQKEKEILKKAHEQAKKLILEAKNQQDELWKESELKNKKHAEDVLREAKAQIEQEAKETEKRLASHVSEVAVLFLQKSLSGIFSEKDQEQVIKNALKKLKKETN